MPKSNTLNQWCKSKGYGGVTKDCVISAFNSSDENISKMAKREKLKGVIDNVKRKT